MKLRWGALSALVLVGVTLSFWLGSTPTAAASPQVAAATTAGLTMALSEDKEYSYVGNKKCKKCHIAIFKSWEKTKMGQAFETLKPGNAKENKEKFKIDLAKDHTKDTTCLKCHTVGFGKPGGYSTPDPTDKKAVRKAKNFQGVGCEMCHGPGSEYVKVFDEIQKSKRKYKIEELRAVGLLEVNKEGCLTCHNEESPTIDKDYKFDYEKKKDEGTHEHKPLKQREE